MTLPIVVVPDLSVVEVADSSFGRRIPSDESIALTN